MRKRYKVLTIIMLMLVFVFIACIEIKGSQVDKVIDEFISRGELVKIENKIAYYKVVRKYDYENTENIIDSLNDVYVGTTGDIYVSAKDPLSFFVTKYMSKNLRMGHGGIVKSEDATITVEVTGNSGRANNVVKEYENKWFQKSNIEITVLRVKGIDIQEKTKLNKWLEDRYGMPYNYNFFKHYNNKFYCFDLCSEAYKSLGYQLDNGYNTTLGGTMIKNEDAYIIYYKKQVNKENINFEVYYLSEE